MSKYFMIAAFLAASLVEGHGYVKSVTIDGTQYQGFTPMIDAEFDVKRVVWSFPKQNTFGVGPVVDVTSPDIACRAGATPGSLTAPARAGAQIKFQWSNYFRSHKGPVITYMAPFENPNTAAQNLKFFKIDEAGLDPKTHTWATDVLISQNNSWTVTIPSDIKPGKYVVRHELIALQFGSSGNPEGPGTVTTGAQYYPICVNVQITGTGTAVPPGVTFPGAYKPTDPGVIYNVFFGPNSYVIPGPPLYQGKHDSPVGPAPTVEFTGAVDPDIAPIYDTAVLAAEKEFNKIQQIVDKALPGGGGCHWDVDAQGKEIVGTNKCTPVNDGLSLSMVDSPFIKGEFPGGAAYKGTEKAPPGLAISEIPGIFGKDVNIKGRRFVF